MRCRSSGFRDLLHHHAHYIPLLILVLSSPTRSSGMHQPSKERQWERCNVAQGPRIRAVQKKEKKKKKKKSPELIL
ncbi:hypothetical protein BDV39DRAFT_178616, partial [Aspergillus sergii]